MVHKMIGVALITVAMLAGCSAPPGPSAPLTPAAPIAISDLDSIAIESDPDPDWVTATDQGVWVANVGEGLVRYDDAGEVTASVATGVVEQAMEVGFGSLWLGSHRTEYSIIRFDLADPTVVVEIPLGDGRIPPESSLAVTDSAIWALVGGGTGGNQVVSFDPVTNARGQSFTAPVGASAVRGGFGSLWVTSSSLGTVTRIDPQTGEELASIPVGNRPQFIAIGTDAVWVMNQGTGSVSRVDPETNTVGEPIEVSSRGIDGGDIVAGPDSVWVRTSAELAVEIDPATSLVVRSIGPASGSGSIAIDGSAVWISAHDVHTVWRVQF